MAEAVGNREAVETETVASVTVAVPSVAIVRHLRMSGAESLSGCEAFRACITGCNKDSSVDQQKK